MSTVLVVHNKLIRLEQVKLIKMWTQNKQILKYVYCDESILFSGFVKLTVALTISDFKNLFDLIESWSVEVEQSSANEFSCFWSS